MKVSAQKWKVKSNGRMRLKSKILKLTGQRDQQTDVTEKSVTVTEDGGTEITQPEQRKENHSGGSQAQRPVGQTLKVCLSPWGPPKEEEPPRSGQPAPPVCRTPPAPGSRETHTQTRLRKRREPGTEEPGRQRGGDARPARGSPSPAAAGEDGQAVIPGAAAVETPFMDAGGISQVKDTEDCGQRRPLS